MGNSDFDSFVNVTNKIITNLNKIDGSSTEALEKTLSENKKNITEQESIRFKLSKDKSLTIDQQAKISNLLNQQASLASGYKIPENIPNQTQNKTNPQQSTKLATTSDAIKFYTVTHGPQILISAGKKTQKVGAMLPDPTGQITAWTVRAGLVMELTGEAAQLLLDIAAKLTTLGNTFGDKLIKNSGDLSESLKGTFRNVGLISGTYFGDKPTADKLTKNIIDASFEMVTSVGINYGPKQIAEFQNAYAEIEKTSLTFSSNDYAVIGEMQTLLDMSAQQSADFVSSFVDIGGNVDQAADFFVSLMDSANQAGVQTKSMTDDIKKNITASKISRLYGGIDDMSKMMAYSKRIKVNLDGMFKLMDSISDPGEAIDLTQQLQALDTIYLGLDPIELIAAQQNDVKKFTDMVVGPIRDNIEDFFDVKSGQLTQRGNMFSRMISQYKGINQVFTSAQDVVDIMAKAAKDKDVLNAIIPSALNGFDKDQIGNLTAQISAFYDKSNMTYKGTPISSMSHEYLDNLLKTGLNGKNSKAKIKEAVKGTVSVKDQMDVNQQLFESLSWTTGVLDSVNKLFKDPEFIKTLIETGKNIEDIGTYVMNEKIFKQIEVLTKYVGLNVAMAYTYMKYLGDTVTPGKNDLANYIQSALKAVEFALDRIPQVGDDTTTNSRGGVINVSKIKLPSNTIASSPKMGSPSINNKILFNLLSEFTTNTGGAGVMSQFASGNTKIIVSGEIRNKINDKDVGSISGEKVLKILEKHLV